MNDPRPSGTDTSPRDTMTSPRAGRQAAFGDVLRYLLRHRGVWLMLALLVPALAALAGTAGARWIPVLRDHARLRQEVRDLRREIVQVVALDNILEAFHEAETVTRTWQAQLSAGSGSHGIETALSEWSRAAGLRVRSVTHREERHPAGLRITIQDLAAEGSYPAFRALLRRIDAAPTHPRVRTLLAEGAARGGPGPGDSNPGPTLRVALQVAFFHPDAPPAPASREAAP